MCDTRLVKVEGGVAFYKKLPKWCRMKYYQVLEGKCMLCQKNMTYNEMDVHRVKRKWFYTFCKIGHKNQNCMMIHKACHAMLHANEPGHGSHSY